MDAGGRILVRIRYACRKSGARVNRGANARAGGQGALSRPWRDGAPSTPRRCCARIAQHRKLPRPRLLDQPPICLRKHNIELCSGAFGAHIEPTAGGGRHQSVPRSPTRRQFSRPKLPVSIANERPMREASARKDGSGSRVDGDAGQPLLRPEAS